MSNKGREARLHYMPGTFRVLTPGDHVRCAATGQPIPLAEMREWQQATVDRIRALRPERVLEIGAGSGLLLGRLAPECEAYWATDLSGAVVRRLAEQTAARPDLTGRVVLRHQAAHDVTGLPAASFDLVVLNSVVQYFPTLDYLDAVLARVVDARDEGRDEAGGALRVGPVGARADDRVGRVAIDVRDR